MPKTDVTLAALDADPKLKAFNEVVAAMRVLVKAEQYAVLNAAAKYFEFTIKLDV